MATTRKRLERIEGAVRFREWIGSERMLESMSEEELEVLAATGQWPDRPEPAPGTSSLDDMSRQDLIKMWKEALRRFAGRNSEDLEFYALHGHWPEQACRYCREARNGLSK